MSGIVGIVALISLETTRQLVASGLGLGFDGNRYTRTLNPATGVAYPPLAITGATNATPIVITTASPHRFTPGSIGGASVVVSGVTGNTAANHVSDDPRDVSVGLPQGTLAVPLTATTLALYGQTTASQGALVALSGNGSYAGGGTLTPGLTDGSILMGRERADYAQSAPPRIVMIPTKIRFGARFGSIAAATRTQDRTAQIQRRSVRTDFVTFEIQVWGAALPPNPALDFDATRAIYQCLDAAVHDLLAGNYDLIDGDWTDQKGGATQFLKSGHLATFGLAIGTPITDTPYPLAAIGASPPFVPSGTSAFGDDQTVVEIIIPPGDPEVGAVL